MQKNSVLFNPLTVALDGVNLIEASAGSGKTWNITALFVRLLIDQSMGEPPAIERILVVTFTKAATAELKNRLRERVREALSALENINLCADDFLKQLLAPYSADAALKAKACARLKLALNSFDLAAIYTIHGFCQRVLTDAAFESGQPFNTELINKDEHTLSQLTADFWRKNIVYEPLYSAIVSKDKDRPQNWLKQVKKYLGKAYINKILPNTLSLEKLTELIAKRESAWQELSQFEDFEFGCEIFWKYFSGLHGGSYKEPAMRELIAWLRNALQNNSSVIELNKELREKLKKLTQDFLQQKTNKNETTPKHILFELIQNWLLADESLIQEQKLQIIRLKFSLIEWLNTESAKRRHILRERCYDDLISDLSSALNSQIFGQVLADNIANTWQVALIDEFQDTDPQQYQIFRAGFIKRSCSVFLVGDPKQAIYAFRGADIFAYLSARDDANRQYTLDTNYRSVAPLVEGVNALFSREKAFLLDIPYHPIIAGAECGTLVDSAKVNPFCWQWGESLDEKNDKESTDLAAAAHAANDIANLLSRAANGEAFLQKGESKRALCGGDIAVLVTSHRQGDLIRQALAKRAINSVILSQQSVWKSKEASEILSIMRAWQNPTNESLFRNALATELIGLDAAELFALEHNFVRWEALQSGFFADKKTCLEHGFMAAWRQCFLREKMAQRLLPLSDGERRLTNLAHLSELIQQQAVKTNSLEALLAWLTEYIVEPPSAEEFVLRLESDENLVNILTIHAAKGLQFSVVYCPFLWNARTKKENSEFFLYHQNNQANLIPKELISAEQQELIENEQFAEKIRLLYVALTRAEHRLWVYWTSASGVEGAALSWLLHAKPGLGLSESKKLIKGNSKEKIQGKSAEQLLAELKIFISANSKQMTLLTQPQINAPLATPQKVLSINEPRHLSRNIFTPWRISSFTALAGQHVAFAGELSTNDDEAMLDILPGAITEFPHGTRAGSCLHAILENIDFTDDAEVIRKSAAIILPRFGFADEYLDSACKLIFSTLNTPIDQDICLANIPRKQRLSELQFYLPLNFLQVNELRKLLSDEQFSLHPLCRAAAAKLDFKNIQGYLRGFIDLIIIQHEKFYLLDYKSNFLGTNLSDYADNNLAKAIADSHYYLQYLIYCVAFRRYLISRGNDYEKSFAGIRYMFMRGLNHHGNGVWCDFPDVELIKRLDELFIGVLAT